MILAFVGNGEGKTTAAVGHAVRAAGHGKFVAVIQFLKGSESTGEYKYLSSSQGPGAIIIKTFGHSEFLMKGSDRGPHAEKARQGLLFSKEAVSKNKFFLIVLDEIFDACAEGLISETDLESLIDSSLKSGINLVMTGRKVPAALEPKMDLITEMNKVKHYYDKGIKGVEGLDR